MSSSPPRPTDAELAILQVLWQQGPSSVRLVYDQLGADRDVGYTTILKLMQIMVDKGLARRDTTQRMHIYEAAVQEKEVHRTLVQRLVDTTFQGSAAKLVLQALGQGKTSVAELAEIKRLIAQMEDDKNKANK